jgi:hypothetical protein
VDLRLCLGPDDYERLLTREWERPDDLADVVFAIEGFDPPYDLRLWRAARDRIARYLTAPPP